MLDGVVEARQLAVLARRPLDVHQHQAAAALGRQLEQRRVERAADVVDRDGAGVESLLGDLGRERVGRDREPGRSPRPAIAGTRRAASSAGATGGPLRAATAPTSSMSKPASASATPSAIACSGVPLRAPSNIESVVTLTIPAPSGPVQGQNAVRESPVESHGSTGNRPRTRLRLRLPAMALRCVYTDLDGTLLGRFGSLFRDAEGNFSMLQARAIEACHRADVEIVIKSGRRQPQVLEDARLIGQTSYIYEAGCAVMIDGEDTVLIGDFRPDEGRSVYDTIVDRGVPDLLFESFAPALEYHAPWHTERVHSHLFRGKIDVAEANAILEREGHAGAEADRQRRDRPPDGRRRGPRPRLPPDARRGEQGQRGRASTSRPAATRRRSASRSATRSRTSASPPVVGRFFVPANGPERDPGLARADRLGPLPQRHGDRGSDGRRRLRGDRLDARRGLGARYFLSPPLELKPVGFSTSSRFSITRSMRPYSAASSDLKKRSRSWSSRTCFFALPVCFA